MMQVSAKPPRLPVEVCEHVVDAVYDDRYYLVPPAFATLCSCTLVCHAWRSRAQKLLFANIILGDKNGLCQFAELLQASPELGTYVRSLELRGYLHVPYSPVVLFPRLLGAALTNLLELGIRDFSDDEKSAKPLSEGVKELPTLPIHRYLPSLLNSSSISRHIHRLNLMDVRFVSFGEFARVCGAFTELETLYCERVSWGVLGQDPPCMSKNRPGLPGTRHGFLPHLQSLTCYDMDEQGRNRLLSALGPSLLELRIKYPNNPPTPADGIKRPVTGGDSLSLPPDRPGPFPHFDYLMVDLAPFPQPRNKTADLLLNTLMSWTGSDLDAPCSVRASQQHLYLEPWRRDEFTREEFADLLYTIGPVVESALSMKETTADNLSYSEPESGEEPDTRPLQVDPCRATVCVGELGDRVEWEGWWTVRVGECFPSFATWNQLKVNAFQKWNP